MENRKEMTPEEKQLIQAKHRLEAMEARDRVKERKERTRRLILEGAELERIHPSVRDMNQEELRYFLTMNYKKHM